MRLEKTFIANDNSNNSVDYIYEYDIARKLNNIMRRNKSEQDKKRQLALYRFMRIYRPPNSRIIVNYWSYDAHVTQFDYDTDRPIQYGSLGFIQQEAKSGCILRQRLAEMHRKSDL